MKKFISLVLAAAMLFSFAACNADKPENPVNESTTSAENNNSAEKKNDIEFLSVYTEKAYEYETYTEDYYYLTELNYQKLHLSEENKKNIPALQKLLILLMPIKQSSIRIRQRSLMSMHRNSSVIIMKTASSRRFTPQTTNIFFKEQITLF